MAEAFGGRAAEAGAASRWDAAMALAARAGPLLLFGLRMWAAVCLALYVAFWLELDNAYWAATSAALVSQPSLGASLRKGYFRMVGTVVGALAIVVLTATFPQSRIGFFVGLALWCALCAGASTLLRNFAAYAAALAGITAAVIALDQLGAVGGLNGEAFRLAITRVSEIWIGIVCAGVVLMATDLGGAPRRLARLIAGVSSDISSRFMSMLATGESSPSQTRSIRRELIRRVIALDPVIEEALGESSRIRYHSPLLREAVDGLLGALAGWRDVAGRLVRLSDKVTREEVEAVLRSIPAELRAALSDGDPARWIADPVGLLRLCEASIRSLAAAPARTASLQLITDRTARVLSGLSDALEALALLVADPDRRESRRGTRIYVPDWAPFFINTARAFAAIGVAEVFWVVSAWPSGALAIVWAAIVVIFFAPRADQAYAAAVQYSTGVGIAVVYAAILLFAILPHVRTFLGLSIALGVYIVPAGAMVAQPWRTAMFVAMSGIVIPILGPRNLMSYDASQFYNSALAIFAGCSFGALSYRLAPSLAPSVRTQRLLRLSLRDLRRLAAKPSGRLAERWRGLMYSRLVAVPDPATPLERARLLALLSVGTELIELHRGAGQLGLAAEFNPALRAIANGDNDIAVERLSQFDGKLGQFDGKLAEHPTSEPARLIAAHARAQILVISDALDHHREYFDAGAPA